MILFSVVKSCPSAHVLMSQNEDGTLFTFKDNCYEIIPRERTWTDAERDCQARGGHLAHITDATEQDAIYSIVKSYHNDHVWIGLHDRNDEEDFQWSSGKK